MDNITINDEGLMEISPTASRDEQMAFIDTYKQLQGENTAQIGTQAHALGSDLPAQLGGLHGPSEYMKSRYQTPQTESRVASLRTAAQLSALNQLMQNEKNKWSNRYNQAYRAASKRASGGGGGNTGGGGNDTVTGGVDEIVSDTSVDYTSSGTNVPGLKVDNETYVDADGNYITRDMNSGEILYVNGYKKAIWDYMQSRRSGVTNNSGGGGW